MERMMTQTHDFDEMVELITTVRPANGPDDVDTLGRVSTLPLREAVRTVIEDWDGDKLKQMSVVIVKQAGTPIQSLGEIQELYKQIEGKRPS
jgi:hypothetical protein